MTRILIPVNEDNGRQSSPNTNFGSSPYYLVIDTKQPGHDTVVKNTSAKYGGELPPIKFILNQRPDVIFTRHACENALKHLKAAEITPYFVPEEPVEELVTRYRDNALDIMVEASH